MARGFRIPNAKAFLVGAGKIVTWILTRTGVSSANAEYQWFDEDPPGVWNDEFFWTEDL